MTPVASAPLPVAIGPYRVLTELGRGGMAFVYLAVARKHPTFTKLLVIKVLRPELATEAEFVAMFMNEARVAAQLSHPNVVQTYEVGEHEGRPFIAMEYLEGLALSKVISRAAAAGVLPMPVHLRILTDMLAGLHYAHELVGLHGQPLTLVHRDVSPHNVLVSHDGPSKVLDFGIAKVTDTTQTREGIVKGKIAYMAPEQLSGFAVDRRADVFAAGIMLWEAIARRKLVERADVEAGVVHRRITGGEPRLLVVRPDAPRQLVAVCEKAMAVRPEDRFATAAEMRDAIEEYSRVHAPADTRDVAEFMDAVFGEERSKLRKLVEQRLRDEAAPPSAEPARASQPSSPETPAASSTGGVVPPSIPPPQHRRMIAPAFAAGLLLVGITAFVVVMATREARPASAASVVSSPPPSLVVPAPLAAPSAIPAPTAMPLVATAVASASAAPLAAKPIVHAAPVVQELDPREQRKKRSIYTEDPYK